MLITSIPTELENKDTTYTDRSVSLLDLDLEIDNEERNITSLFMTSILPL